MDDHPHDTRPLSWWNFATNKKNFLYEMSKAYDVWTTLVVTDWDGHYLPLAHVQWGARCTTNLEWFDTSAGPVHYPPVLVDAKFNEPVVKRGPPTGPGLVDMITNPNTDEKRLYNYVSKNVIVDMYNSKANNANVTATSSWDPHVVPPSHFR